MVLFRWDTEEALINIDNHDVQSDIYHKVVTQNLSVREQKLW